MMEAAIKRQFPAAEESAGFRLDVEFTAEPGVTVLFGPSGAGKTLTLDAVAGFITPSSGRILLDGRILFDAEAKVNIAPRRRHCGYVFQNYTLFPHMTLRENLTFAAHRLPRLERHRKIAESLSRFHLTELAGRYPKELSGGQIQRGSIARALMAEPKILLLDEPARGLDAVLRDDLRAVLLGMKKSLGIPILLVTHDPEECFALGDRVLIYDDGRIVQRGAPLDLLRNPGNAVAARLLGDFNIFEAEVLALDPARQTSRIRMLDEDLDGPHLRGCFRGDRITLCARPEELRIAVQPGANRLRANLVSASQRPQSVRADFGRQLIVDVPRDQWTDTPENIWVEIPPRSLRLLRQL